MNRRTACGLVISMVLVCTWIWSASAATLTVVAGGGLGDGLPATLASIFAEDVAVGENGDVYVLDTRVKRVWRIDAGTGIAQCIGGGGDPKSAFLANSGHAGDGGPATSMAFTHYPSRIAVDSAGSVYLVITSDQTRDLLRKIDGEDGTITTLMDLDTGFGIPSDGPVLKSISEVVVSDSGDLYFADYSYNDNRARVWKVESTTGAIVPVAGAASGWGFSGDGGPATAAKLDFMSNITLDRRGGFSS